MVPAAVVYGIYAEPGSEFYLAFATGVLLAPLIPDVIGSFAGMLIALVASRFERSSLGVIVIFLLLGTIALLIMGNREAMEETLVRTAPQFRAVLHAAYPPAAWFMQSCCFGSATAFAKLAGVSLGAYAVYCWLLGKQYRRVNSILNAYSSSPRRHRVKIRVSGTRLALLRKEFRTLFASPTYFLDAAMSPLMAVVIAVLAYFGLYGKLTDLLMPTEQDTLAHDAAFVYATAAYVLAIFVGQAETSAVSVSLEGRSLWIVKTAPVTSRMILQAKLQLNLILCASIAAVSGLLLILQMPPDPSYSPFLILTPFVFGILSTVRGQKINLRQARFDWLEMSEATRRNKHTIMMRISNSVLGLGGLVICVLWGTWLMLVMDALMLLWAAAVYRWLMTKGIQVFDRLGY